MEHWVQEPRALTRLPENCRRDLFMDNCPSPTMTDEMILKLECINIEICIFPGNATYLLQLADFVIARIEAVRRKRWDQYESLFFKAISKQGCSFGTQSVHIPNQG